MNRPHFRRHPRPVDPEPYTRLDVLDGLPGRTRYDAEWPDVRAAERDEPWELPLLRAQDAVLAEWVAAEWSSLPPVFAPHSFVGGDLAAMAAPWPGMARDDLGVYAEPVEADPFGRRVCPTCESPAPHLHPAVQFEGEVQPCADPFHYAEVAKPRGRHRQTDPLDLILADLRDLDGL